MGDNVYVNFMKTGYYIELFVLRFLHNDLKILKKGKQD